MLEEARRFGKNRIRKRFRTHRQGKLAAVALRRRLRENQKRVSLRGMVVGQLALNMASEQIITAAFTYNGMSGAQSTTSLDDTPEPATTNRSMSANVDVGRVAESGATVVGPNFVRSASITINNNLRMITAIGNVGAVDIGVGECAASLQLETYFGSNALLAKLLDGELGNLSFRMAKDRQGLVIGFPRVTFTDGAPSANAKNQDVTLPLAAQASIDPATGAQVLIDRFEYVE